MLKNHVFGSLNLNNSEIFRLSFDDIFLGTLDIYTIKMNPPSAVLGGGVHGKVCWLIAYYNTTTTSNIYSIQMISIILQISSFDNVSHDDKPSRISHNSIISWLDLLYIDFCCFFSQPLIDRWFISKCQSW